MILHDKKKVQLIVFSVISGLLLFAALLYWQRGVWTNRESALLAMTAFSIIGLVLYSLKVKLWQQWCSILVAFTFALFYGQIKPQKWTAEFRLFIINDLKTSKFLSAYPQLADETCSCFADNVIAKLTVNEYKNMMRLPADERLSKMQPYLHVCIDTFLSKRNKLESGNENNWTASDKAILINDYKATLLSTTKDTQLVVEAANCLAEKVITKTKHQNFIFLTQKEKFAQVRSLGKDCIDTLRRKLNMKTLYTK